MFLCSLRYCLECYFSKGVYSFTLITVKYIYYIHFSLGYTFYTNHRVVLNIHNALCSDLKVQPSVMSVNTETVIDKNNDFALIQYTHTHLT